MNKKNRVAFGPGAASLILIVVVLSMSVLGMLALMSAHNDMRLSRRSVEVVEAVYALQNQAERSFASLDAVCAAAAQGEADEEAYREAVRRNLPAGMYMEEDVVQWEETDGVRTIECAARIPAPHGEGNLQWTAHRLSAVAEETWN